MDYIFIYVRYLVIEISKVLKNSFSEYYWVTVSAILKNRCISKWT